jgi:uncharacterized membrane protein
MKQNRMGAIADRRDHLDLQVNLLTERRATRIIQMLERLSAHLGLEQHGDPDSSEFAQISASGGSAIVASVGSGQQTYSLSRPIRAAR